MKGAEVLFIWGTEKLAKPGSASRQVLQEKNTPKHSSEFQSTLHSTW